MPVRDCERRLYPTEIPSDTGKNVQPPQRKAADQKDKTQKITIHITILFIYVCMDNILVVVIHPSIHPYMS